MDESQEKYFGNSRKYPKNIPGKSGKKKNKSWISEGTLKAIEERKIYKGRRHISKEDNAMHKALHKRIKRLTKKDKVSSLQDKCQEIEQELQGKNPKENVHYN